MSIPLQRQSRFLLPLVFSFYPCLSSVSFLDNFHLSLFQIFSLSQVEGLGMMSFPPELLGQFDII